MSLIALINERNQAILGIQIDGIAAKIRVVERV